MTNELTVYRGDRNKTRSLERYEMHREQAIAMLERMLDNLRADVVARSTHNESPINWGDVGMMADYAERLQTISDAMFHEGEHAPERNAP